jgi:U4/U6.U5 tri-snRNP component SNU23
MSSINKSVNVERRTWDKEAFEARARSRAAAAAAADAGGDRSVVSATAGGGGGDEEDVTSSIKNKLNPTEEKEEFLPAQQGRAGPMGSQRAYLKSRSNKVDLESKLGSTEIIDPAAASATRSKLSLDNDSVGGGSVTHSSGVSKCADGVGWHCRVCDCFLKDSLTYLDHINGKKHQRYLGYTMRVEKSTTEEVSGVLKSLAEKKLGGMGHKNNYGSGRRSEDGGNDSIDFEDVVRKKDEEALRRKAERARKREDRKRQGEKDEALNNESGQLDLVVQNHADDEEAATPADDNNPVEEEDGEEEDEEADEEEIDPNIASMMGFSGFSGRRK